MRIYSESVKLPKSVPVKASLLFALVLGCICYPLSMRDDVSCNELPAIAY